MTFFLDLCTHWVVSPSPPPCSMRPETTQHSRDTIPLNKIVRIWMSIWACRACWGCCCCCVGCGRCGQCPEQCPEQNHLWEATLKTAGIFVSADLVAEIFLEFGLRCFQVSCRCGDLKKGVHEGIGLKLISCDWGTKPTSEIKGTVCRKIPN
jgi:hypothetical protein